MSIDHCVCLCVHCSWSLTPARADFEARLNQFFEENASEVVNGCDVGESKLAETSYAGQEGEFTLRAHELYQEYLKLTERHFEAFLTKEDIDSATLQRELKELQETK